LERVSSPLPKAAGQVVFCSRDDSLLQKTQLAVCLRKQIPPERDWAIALLTFELAGTDFTVIFFLLFRIKKLFLKFAAKLGVDFGKVCTVGSANPCQCPANPCHFAKGRKIHGFLYIPLRPDNQSATRLYNKKYINKEV
jgi:hypothetical protein